MAFGGMAAETGTFQDPWADRRGEARLADLVDTALLHFRGKPYRVPGLNISSRGAMIECPLDTRLGEPVLVEFDQCSRMHAFVRWSREGRIGLNFGHELVLGS
ncbi:PilZ domain-containing protein [Sphingosinicella sp. BN140058]|uniref:PilZ domain-containing protein n=1 Tax=Sphingosinicella sp. BN140058 TaxID=1892855 RepID=UPI00101252CA|nr:PilZ domain-containing protein [Sphingosinicella sp. BN140058]QAY76667.1 PilZ domain-containing protein [Sphingosinicella sp. BN140058]